MTGTDYVHVPYKGGGPALTAILGAEVSILFNNIVSAMPHVLAGKLRALGITSPRRSPVVPDMPTVAEAGVPGYEIVSWYGVLGPAGVPASLVSRLNREINAAMNADEVRSRLAVEGVEVGKATPAEFSAYIKKEIAKWGEVIRKGRIKSDS
jgi:tripartite-type tricarboxylate transporter receptor subunit TctC